MGRHEKHELFACVYGDRLQQHAYAGPNLLKAFLIASPVCCHQRTADHNPHQNYVIERLGQHHMAHEPLKHPWESNETWHAPPIVRCSSRVMAASAGSADSGHEPPLWEVSAFAVSPPTLSVLATLFSGVLKARSHRAPPFAGLVPRRAVSVDEAARIGAQAQLLEDQAAFWWRRRVRCAGSA